jgi:tetratricopeptide (TPR) repeat protein
MLTCLWSVSQIIPSTKSNQAFIEVAHYYFDQGNYTQALQWFEKVNESQLSGNDKFKKGYSFFNSKNKKEATTYFNRVVNSQEYGSQASIIWALWLMRR